MVCRYGDTRKTMGGVAHLLLLQDRGQHGPQRAEALDEPPHRLADTRFISSGRVCRRAGPCIGLADELPCGGKQPEVRDGGTSLMLVKETSRPSLPSSLNPFFSQSYTTLPPVLHDVDQLGVDLIHVQREILR